MNAMLGKEMCPAVENEIKGNSDPSVFWNCLKTDGIESIVGAIQVFSDKSQMTLSSDSVQFYTLHLTLLNLRNETHTRHINSGSSVISYLPCSFLMRVLILNFRVSMVTKN